MSVYSIENDGRFRLCSVIFGGSLVVSVIINHCLNCYWNLMPDSLLLQDVITVSPTLICALILGHIPRFLFPLFHIPDIDGEYFGTLVSSFDENMQLPVKLIIKQRMFNISIVLETESSYSRNNTAYIATNDDGSVELIYTYKNEGRCLGTRLTSHSGTCCARVSSQSFNGRYYSDPDRKTYGILDMAKI